MNTKINSLALTALALMLITMAPLGSLAQAQNDKNRVSPGDQERQAIRNKLESIRVESITFNALPLSEALNQLRRLAKQKDPEKNGINFVINSNPDDEPGAVAGAVEQMDAGSVTINITPAINDVSLADVLDAVVRVADHPIKYTIESYGVVFSPRGFGQERKESASFSFPGGTPSDFLKAVEDQCKADWQNVADVPPEMMNISIPRLRLQGGSNDLLAEVVSLYNQLGEQKPALGKLIVKGDWTKPSVVMFVPDKSSAEMQPKFKVKAFSIYGINGGERVKLQEDIDAAKEQAMKYALERRGASGLDTMRGTVAIHNDTSLLVAAGPDSFVDMVESIVAACQSKEHARQAPAKDLPNDSKP